MSTPPRPIRPVAKNRRMRVALVALALLLVGVLAGGWWLDHGGPILFSRTLRARPEATFFYPESTVLANSGYNYSVEIAGPRRAMYTTVLGVDATDADILGFYQARMSVLPGWGPASFNGNTGTRDGRAWTDGQVMLSIRLPDATQWRAARLAGSNVYQVELFSLSPR